MAHQTIDVKEFWELLDWPSYYRFMEYVNDLVYNIKKKTLNDGLFINTILNFDLCNMNFIKMHSAIIVQIHEYAHRQLDQVSSWPYI